jgi:hypothetical protein
MPKAFRTARQKLCLTYFLIWEPGKDSDCPLDKMCGIEEDSPGHSL